MGASLDPRVTHLLEGLRHQIRRWVVWDSVLTLVAVILGAFWLGLALDYLPVLMGGTEMPRLARLILLVLVAALVVGILWKTLISRLARPLPDDSLALLLERHHPELGGRLVTAVQLNRLGRHGDSHSSELLRNVHDQAVSRIDQVDPARVFQRAPLMKKALVAGPLLLMAIVMLVISPQAFGRAASRLTLFSNDPWPRRAHLEMVGVELPVVSAREDDTTVPRLIRFVDKVIRLPRGSSGTLRIQAKADEGAELPDVCTVHYDTVALEDVQANVLGSDPAGSSPSVIAASGQSNMRRVGRVTEGYQSFLLDGPPLASLSDSVDLSVRGLDDRLDGYRIEAVMPPVITDMQIIVRYPEYLRRPGDERRVTSYQSGLRLAEGSAVTLIATSSVPLGDSEVLVNASTQDPVSFSVEHSDDRRELRLQIESFTQATTVTIVPVDAEGISAQAPYRYFLGVVLDEPPELKMKLVGIGSAVTPQAKIPVEATVHDDYGVRQLTVSLTPSGSPASSGDEPQTSTASKNLSVDRDGQAKVQLDLRDLIAEGQLSKLIPGDVVNVLGEASDRYNLTGLHTGTHLTRSEIFRLQVVTPDKLLSLLERRELALRARLEQTIDETRNLRDALSLLQRGFNETKRQAESSKTPTPETPATESPATQAKDQALLDQTRVTQVRRLRIQQSGLQASKTSDELSGIATSLDDILLEMTNNRVDSVDRRERIGTGVRDPLRRITDGSLARLREQIATILPLLADDTQARQATETSVQTAEEVLLQLTAVLEKMLDLESYNEILDMVRGLLDDQEKLIDETKKERRKGVLDLFE